MCLIAAFLGWMFDGMEMGIFPLVARPALQEMQVHSGIVDDKFVSHWMGWITAWFLWGAACGGIVFGWLGDRIGRVRAMTLSILCYSLFTGLSYFAQQPWHLAFFRFIAALGMGGEWSLGVALVMECWPAKHRPMLAGAIGAAANVGFALIAVFGIVFPITKDSWRWVMLIGAAPAFLTFFIRLFVPESERWKEAVKETKAQPLREIFSSGLFKTTLLAIAFASISLIVTWGAVQWIGIWADQLAGKELPRAKAYAQLSSGLGAVIGCIAGAWVAGRFGRRPAYFMMCLLSLIFGSWLFRGMSAFNAQFLALVFVVGGVTAAFYGWLPLYLPELFPTRVRATAQGLSFNFGRILAGFGALQMGALVQKLGGKSELGADYAGAGATIILIYILGLVLIWLAPETKGRPLPE